MDGFGASSDRASQAAEGHKLSLGRIERALGSYVGHAVGANAVTEQLSVAFGGFAAGGTIVTGVLLGIGAVVAVFEHLTEGSRKAMEAADKLAVSYNELARIQVFGSKEAADIDTLNKGLEQHNKWLGAIIALRVRLGSLGGLLSGVQGSQSEAITANAEAKRAAEQKRINDIGLQDAKDNQAWADRIKKENDKATEAALKAQEALIRYNEAMKAAYGGNLSITPAIRGPQAGRRAGIDTPITPEQGAAITGQVMGPLAGPNQFATDASLAEAVKAFRDGTGKQLADAEKHSQDVQNAIWGAAQQSASLIVGALNIGGGGKGSNLGGAIGSTAGFAIGFSMGGPVGGAIGSTAGNIFGSLIGGLFDNSQATRENTNATRQLVQALIQFAPSGFKVEPYRYGATDTKGIMDSFTRYKTRGGVVRLGT